MFISKVQREQTRSLALFVSIIPLAFPLHWALNFLWSIRSLIVRFKNEDLLVDQVCGVERKSGTAFPATGCINTDDIRLTLKQTQGPDFLDGLSHEGAGVFTGDQVACGTNKKGECSASATNKGNKQTKRYLARF